MYKGKFVHELSMSEVKKYYDELRLKYPLTEDQWKDYNVLKERLIALAYKILDSKTNGDLLQAVFEVKDIDENFMTQTIMVTMNDARKTFGRDWWYAPCKVDKE